MWPFPSKKVPTVIERATARTPTILAEFEVINRTLDKSWVIYRVKAKADSASLHFFATPTEEPDLDWLNPIYVGSTPDVADAIILFDSEKHGYDGVLNGGASYIQGNSPKIVNCANCGVTPHILNAVFSYQFDLEEVEKDWSEEQRALLPDLFDTVSFSLECKACKKTTSIGAFECA